MQPTDLSVRPGATTVLIGPSGCGKSTLLRLMIYLIRPNGGSVRFEGTEFSADDVLRLRHRMGYVIQDGGLFPHLSAADNVALLPARNTDFFGATAMTPRPSRASLSL